jgi:DNA-directed RNA polymerase subunit A'
MNSTHFSKGYIKGVSIDVLGPEEIRAKATVTVVSPQTYDEKGLLTEGGILDPRMGICNVNQTCVTCGYDYLTCKGHTGVIELPFPVFHSELIAYTYTCLKHICTICYFVQPYGYHTTYLKTLKCKNCSQTLKLVLLEAPTTFRLKWFETDGLKESILYAHNVEEIFLKSNIADLQKLHSAFNKYNPLKGILKCLNVGPVSIRPSLILDKDRTGESDINHKYADIIRTVQKFNKTNADSLLQSTKIHFINLLQYHITTLFNNSSRGIPAAQHRTGKPLISIVEKLKGKEGIFRKNLAGKRVNFAARAVITPSIHLDLDEVGVPKLLAKKMTKPMYITSYNNEELLKMYDEDVTCSKITHIIVNGKKLKVMESNKSELRLYMVPGTCINRTLLEGDIVLLNRNPTLLPQSILSFKIKIHDEPVFTIHPNVCYGYNADFDGDEMNLHLAQNEYAETEAKVLLNVKKNAILLKTSKATLGITKDVIAGLYCLTKYNDVFTSYEVANLTYNTNLFKLIEKRAYTGREIFDLCIPATFNFILTGSIPFEIKCGQLINGYVTKGLFGAEGKVLHVLHSEYGYEIYSEFVKNMTKIGTYSAEYYGLSYGLKDLLILPRLSIHNNTKNIKQEISLKEKEFINIIEQKHLESAAYILADSGAAGNKYTLTLTTLYTGFQAENNLKLFDSMTTKNERLLTKNFINKGLLEGLTSLQYYSAAISARFSLIELFCKTATVGYASRRLLNSLEDYIVKKDGTIRNAGNKILYLNYANHGLDYTKVNSKNKWIDMSQYYQPSKKPKILDKLVLAAILDSLLETHLAEKYSAFLLEGCIKYLETNNYNSKEILLNCSCLDELYEQNKLAVGEPIGLLTGQCIAEPITQLNLNVKHNLGDLKLTNAVDSLLEAIYASKKPKRAFIKLTTDISNENLTIKLYKELNMLKLKDIAQITIDSAKNHFIIKYIPEILEEYNLECANITTKLKTILSTHFIITDINDLELSLSKEMPITSFITLVNYYNSLQNITIHGYEDVTCSQSILGSKIELFIYSEKLKPIIKHLKNYAFEYDVRTNLYSQLYKLYGVLTTKHYLNKEILNIFYNQGLDLQPTHINFIVDVMLHNGILRGLSRSGVVAQKESFLAKAGFETANKVIINAAIRNSCDYLKSIYENTMLGKAMNAGTNTNRIYVA